MYKHPKTMTCAVCGAEFEIRGPLKYPYCPKCRRNACGRDKYHALYDGIPTVRERRGYCSTTGRSRYDGSAQAALARDVIEARKMGLSYGEYRRRLDNE